MSGTMLRNGSDDPKRTNHRCVPPGDYDKINNKNAYPAGCVWRCECNQLWNTYNWSNRYSKWRKSGLINRWKYRNEGKKVAA